MFDLVPFTGARREVSDCDGKTSPISQPLEFEFPEAEARAIAAAAVSGDQEPGGLRINTVHLNIFDV